jgi:hypothetical protein
MTRLRHRRRSFLWVAIMIALTAQAGAQTVSMVPHIALPTTTTFTVDFYLNSDFNEVMGVEIALTFDETIVLLDNITAGDWFTSSAQEYFFWDYTTPGTDTIHFTGALLSHGQVVDGVLAVCHFTALGPGVSPVEFVDVDVRDGANQAYGAGHTIDDQIIIDYAIGNETMSFGRVKGLYR